MILEDYMIKKERRNFLLRIERKKYNFQKFLCNLYNFILSIKFIFHIQTFL